MSDLIPFNPSIHKPIKTVMGMKATEYLMTEKSPEGGAWNIPSIWFDSKTKEPVFLKGDNAWDEAVRFEKRTGKKFPRYKDISTGVDAAKKRSNKGGATKKSLLSKDD
tara:strand:- start:853 stop:1176 length:324 start_codon:yes stop_codon:yes gene_type:complete